MPVKIDEEYCIEKVEAYNVAIEALRQHEGADDVHGLSSLLREKLAAKLDKEINAWCAKYSVTDASSGLN